MVLPSEELHTLVERLAENVHEIWSLERMNAGWTYGPQRCDETQQHPCLIPYFSLLDGGKAYDRQIVLGTIRAILALGFVIETGDPRKSETDH